MAERAGSRGRPRGKGRETRLRIVEAAYKLMSSQGYSQTTMAEVAAAAGVAVPTVYFSFRSKPGLFAEVVRLAVKGDLDIEPTEQAWFGEVRTEPDLELASARVVAAMTEILRRTTPLWAALHGLSQDPELADFQRSSESLRRDGYRLVVDLLTEKSPLRGGLNREEAVTILMVVLGPDVYRSFVHDHGWSVEHWQRWATETLLNSLFRAR